MAVPTIKLILTDIDGTILPKGDKQVSPRTVAAFHAALDAGIAIGPCSGRGYDWIPPFFGGDTACCTTAIATNGLQIYLEGTKVLERSLPHEALQQVRAIVADTPHAGLLCFDGGVPLLLEGTRADLAQAFPAYAETCVDADATPAEPVVKANVFSGGSEQDMRELVARLNAEVAPLDVDHALSHFSNMMVAGWNKGEAVRWVAERLGIGLDEIVIFGDADNDLPMFRVVEHAVAVANATPEASAEARWHIGACADDAVAVAIEAIAAGAWPFTA